MENNTFIYAQKVTGQERKAIAGVIAQALGVKAEYEGVPTCAYIAGKWRVERTGLVRSPETQQTNFESLRTVLAALNAAGLGAEGDASVILSTEGHNGITLRNLVNLILSRERLLQKALKRDGGIIPTRLVAEINIADIESIGDFIKVCKTGIEEGAISNGCNLWLDHMPDEIGICCFNATLNPDEAITYIQLAFGLMNQAKTLRYVSSKDKESDNPRFHLRVFLNRIGFIGREYKFARSFLLKSLEGNSAFRNIPVKEAVSNG